MITPIPQICIAPNYCAQQHPLRTAAWVPTQSGITGHWRTEILTTPHAGKSCGTGTGAVDTECVAPKDPEILTTPHAGKPDTSYSQIQTLDTPCKGNTDPGTGWEALDTPCERSWTHHARHWIRGTGCEALDASHHPTCWETRCELQLTDPHAGHTLPGKHRSRYWMRGPEHTMQGIPDPDTGHTMRGTGCEALDASHPTCCQYHIHLSVSLMPCTVFFFRLHASKQQSESDVVSLMEVMECYVAVDM